MPIFFLFIIPSVSQAGVVSFITELFSGQDVSAQSETVIETSSQNMLLPEPAMNINPSLKTNSGIIIDGGEALLAEVGPSTDAPEKFDNSNGQISIYTVRTGDTLARIAEMFDVSVNTILWANDMTRGSSLKIGQTLVILPISGVMHTVVKGDTLSTIAKKYSGDIDEIANFNDLKITDKLTVGDTLMIPDGQVSTSLRPSSTSGSNSISANSPSYDGYYGKPFITARRTQGIHGYNGVDYALPVGTSLFASAEGTVLIAKNSGWNGGYGQYVVIKHSNNTQTLYAHMSNVSVSVGQYVKKGQIIGSSGNTGKSTGPHIHFEVRGAKNPF